MPVIARSRTRHRHCRPADARKNVAHRDPYHRRLHCEPLEDRRLLSVLNGSQQDTMIAGLGAMVNWSGKLATFERMGQALPVVYQDLTAYKLD